MVLKRREFLKFGGLAPVVAGLPSSSASDPMDGLRDLVKDVPPPPPAVYAERAEKARRLMADEGVDALVIEGGSSLLYFTGASWGRSERMFALVLPRRGNPAYVCPAFELDRASEGFGSAQADIRVWQEDESPFERVAEILADRKVVTGKVAVEPTTRFFLVSGMRAECRGVEFVDGRAISEGCRMIKSKVELELMRLADQITRKAFRVALAGLKEGMTARDLNGRISEAHSRMGVRGGALVLFGPASAFPHGTRETRRLQEGDVVLMDGGCKVHGYSSDVTRTTVFGQPSDRQRKVWQIVRQAQQEVLRTARPGVQCQELDRVARGVIEKAGFGPGYHYFTHRLGHGIGLDGHEAPYLVQGNTLELQPGMTSSNEPGIYIPGEFGVRHEDVMVITEQGAEFFGEGSRDIKDPV